MPLKARLLVKKQQLFCLLLVQGVSICISRLSFSTNATENTAMISKGERLNRKYIFELIFEPGCDAEISVCEQ